MPDSLVSGKPPVAKPVTALAFDYGLRHIGVAVGQSITGTAKPLPVLKANDGVPSWDAIAAIIREWQPGYLVIGLPLNMDGSTSELSQRAEKFARRLQGRFQIPIAMCDERLSSFAAKGEIIERNGSRDFRENNVDSLAAVIILESWFRENY
jgi:putative Holliday junction resolvase